MKKANQWKRNVSGNVLLLLLFFGVVFVTNSMELYKDEIGVKMDLVYSYPNDTQCRKRQGTPQYLDKTLLDGSIQCFFHDEDVGKIWIVTDKDILYCCSINENNIEHNLPPCCLKKSYQTCGIYVYKDQKGGENVLLETKNCIGKLNKNTSVELFNEKKISKSSAEFLETEYYYCTSKEKIVRADAEANDRGYFISDSLNNVEGIDENSIIQIDYDGEDRKTLFIMTRERSGSQFFYAIELGKNGKSDLMLWKHVFPETMRFDDFQVSNTSQYVTLIRNEKCDYAGSINTIFLISKYDGKLVKIKKNYGTIYDWKNENNKIYVLMNVDERLYLVLFDATLERCDFIEETLYIDSLYQHKKINKVGLYSSINKNEEKRIFITLNNEVIQIKKYGNSELYFKKFAFTSISNNKDDNTIEYIYPFADHMIVLFSKGGHLTCYIEDGLD